MTYDEFKEFLLRFLWREGDTQLDSDLDILIAAANAKLTRDLRIPRMTVTGFAFNMIENSATLPADFRRPMLIQDSVSLKPFRSTSPDNLASLQSITMNIGGVQPFYCIAGRKLRVAGAVGAESPLDLLLDYQAKVPDFMVEDETWLLEEGEYTDLYITACLSETPYYLRNDARVGLWTQAYKDKLLSVHEDATMLDWGSPLGSAMPSGVM